MAKAMAVGSKPAKRAPKRKDSTTKKTTAEATAVKSAATMTHKTNKRKASEPIETYDIEDVEVADKDQLEDHELSGDEGSESDNGEDNSSDDENADDDDWEDEAGWVAQPALNHGIPNDGANIPAHPGQRSKNGRKPGRELIVWSRPDSSARLLLIMVFTVFQYAMEVPWDVIAHRMNPGSSGSAILQHMNRLRSHLFMKGHLVPPPFPKAGVPVHPEENRIRGYIRVDEGLGPRAQMRAVGYGEKLPDSKFIRPDFNQTSFPIDTAFEDADIVDKDGNILRHGGQNKRGAKKAQPKEAPVKKSAQKGPVKKTKKASPKPTATIIPEPVVEDSTPTVPKAVTEVLASVETVAHAALVNPIVQTPGVTVAPGSCTAPAGRVRASSKATTTKRAAKKKTAKRVADVDPADLTSDADYDPTAKATPKRRRTLRAKRTKIDHEYGSDKASEASFASISQTAAIAHIPGNTQIIGEVEQIQEATHIAVLDADEEVVDATTFEAQMSHNFAGTDSEMDTASTRSAESSGRHASTPSGAYSPGDNQDYTTPVEIVQHVSESEIHHLGGFLPHMVFDQANDMGSPSTAAHQHHGHNIDGASSVSAIAMPGIRNGVNLFFGHDPDFDMQMTEMKPGSHVMAGNYVAPSQVFMNNMPSIHGHRTAMAHNVQNHSAELPGPRNSHGFSNGGF